MSAIDFMLGCAGIFALAAAALLSVIAIEEAYNWWNYRR
jgi:hypothetical protein